MGSSLESKTKKFHFQEIDWIIYFPRFGNKGKYFNYGVRARDRKKGTTQPREKIKLGETELIPVVSQLSGYDIKEDANSAAVLKWWDTNKERWTIPFPDEKP